MSTFVVVAPPPGSSHPLGHSTPWVTPPDPVDCDGGHSARSKIFWVLLPRQAQYCVHLASRGGPGAGHLCRLQSYQNGQDSDTNQRALWRARGEWRVPACLPLTISLSLSLSLSHSLYLSLSCTIFGCHQTLPPAMCCFWMLPLPQALRLSWPSEYCWWVCVQWTRHAQQTRLELFNFEPAM